MGSRSTNWMIPGTLIRVEASALVKVDLARIQPKSTAISNLSANLDHNNSTSADIGKKSRALVVCPGKAPVLSVECNR